MISKKKLIFKNLVFKTLCALGGFLLFYTGTYLGVFKSSGRFGTFVLTPQSKNLINKSRGLNPFVGKKFYYLSQGSQSFVFESEDHQAVLKLFRFNRTRPKSFFCMDSFFKDTIDQFNHQRKVKEINLLNSIQLACEHPELTYVLGYNLGAFDSSVEVTLYDRWNRKFEIDLGNTVCVLQKKGLNAKKYFETLSIQKQKEALGELTNLYQQLDRLGYEDCDPVISNNCGFDGERAFFLDVGGFVPKQLSACPIESLIQRFEQKLKR